MLDVDKNNSYVINKLREKSKVSRVQLPAGIELSIKNRTLNVSIKNVAQDMQRNSVAFEGWILVLKCWLSDIIEFVVLDFKSSDDLVRKYGCPKAWHYNRFLYRLNIMLRIFPTWFSVKKERMSIVQDFIDWVDSNNLMLNHSLHERKDVIGTKNMERQIESWFVFHEGKKLLSERWNIDEDKLFNQLPVGVFINEIKEKNAVFPCRASAIDIWGVDKDGQGLHLIELKCGNNRGLGVIGETLYYSSIIYNTCIAQKPLFKFGKRDSAQDTSDTKTIKNDGNKFSRLSTYILAEKYHSLFSDDVVDLISNGLKNLGIRFEIAKYCYSKKDFADANNNS